MRRLIALLLSIFMTLSVMTACASNHFSFEHDAEGNEYITNAEWAQALGSFFGMDSCLNDSPYYTDVSSSNPCFPYIQSCYEWEVFDTKKTEFKPDDYAEITFVVDSAAKAAELNDAGYEKYLEYASEEGINLNNDSKYATKLFAITVLEWAYREYDSKPFEEYENVEVKSDVRNFPTLHTDTNGAITNYTGSEEINEGDVIITAPSADDPSGVARKVTGVYTDSNGNTVIETTEPEIGDLYEELDFAYVGTVSDPSNIKTVEGVTLTGVTSVSAPSQNATCIPLSAQSETSNCDVQQLANKGKTLGFAVKLSSSGKVTVSREFEGLKAEAKLGGDPEALDIFEKTGFTQPKNPDDASGSKPAEQVEKYEKGWELEGELKLTDFYVEAALKTKKALGIPYGIESFGYEIHYEVSSSLKFTGKIKDEVAIATIPLPLGSTGIVVEVEVFVKASVSGDIEISASIANTSTVKYTEENGYKKTQSSQCERAIELSVNLKAGFGGRATLKAYGIKLVDVTIELGFGFEASAKVTRVVRYEGKVYQYGDTIAELTGAMKEHLFCIDAMTYYPTASLSLGMDIGTLANKVGFKFTWKIMDKSGATFESKKDTLHYEIGKGFVDECTLDHLQIFGDDEASEVLEEKKENNAPGVGSDVMSVSKYAVIFGVKDQTKLEITTLPFGYSGTDVEWTSENDSIVKISSVNADEDSASCILYGLSPGITSITINTKDGKNSLRCAVTVFDGTAIRYTPLD